MAINKVEFGGQTLIDLTEDTVTPSTLMAGETAHDRSGAAIVGTATGGSSTLAQLTDVNLTNLSDGQIIKYNSTTQKWENVDAGSSDSGAVRIVSETIFEATVDTEVNVDYTLTHSIDDYSFISIYNGVWSEYAGSGSKWVEDAFIPVQSLNAIYDAGKQYAVTSYDTRYLHLTLHDTTLRVIARSNLAVCKIVGHKIVGGSDIVHLTKAEYDALPDTKLSDNKIYMLEDVPSSDTEDKHIILDSEDVVYPQRSFLQFTGNASITDDETNNKTIVDITGGGAEIIEMTQAEYDALPDTKLTDGVLRAIKDEYSPADSKLVGLAECYSLSEKQIGCWTNGKPLYQKTFVYDTTQSSGQITFSTGLLDVDEIISFLGVASYPSGGVNNKWIPLPFSCDSNGYAVGSSVLKINSFLKTTGEIYAYIGTDYQSSYAINRIRITLRYTKTTDVAGSGTWTPEGVPAHHYSTTEQVIGTWVDGKPLYEKTYILNNQSSNINNNILASLDINFMVEGKWILYENNVMKDYFIGYNSSTKLITDKPSGWSHALIVKYTKTTD